MKCFTDTFYLILTLTMKQVLLSSLFYKWWNVMLKVRGPVSHRTHAWIRAAYSRIWNLATWSGKTIASTQRSVVFTLSAFGILSLCFSSFIYHSLFPFLWVWCGFWLFAQTLNWQLCFNDLLSCDLVQTFHCCILPLAPFPHSGASLHPVRGAESIACLTENIKWECAILFL